RIAPAQVELIERLERALPGFRPRAHALLCSGRAQRLDLLQAGERGLAALVGPPRIGALLRLPERFTGEHPEGDRDRRRARPAFPPQPPNRAPHPAAEA